MSGDGGDGNNKSWKLVDIFHHSISPLKNFQDYGKMSTITRIRPHQCFSHSLQNLSIFKSRV